MGSEENEKNPSRRSQKLFLGIDETNYLTRIDLYREVLIVCMHTHTGVREPEFLGKKEPRIYS